MMDDILFTISILNYELKHETKKCTWVLQFITPEDYSR